LQGCEELPKGGYARTRIYNFEIMYGKDPTNITKMPQNIKWLYMCDKEFLRIMEEERKTTRILQRMLAVPEDSAEETIYKVQISMGDKMKRNRDEAEEKRVKKRANKAKVKGVHFEVD
jgi:hypothetical protein